VAQSASARAILPLTAREERWLHDLAPAGGPRAHEVFFGRFDASCDFGSPDWVKSTQFFEFNPLGAGGTYVVPTIDDIVLKHVVPALRRHAPTLLLEPNDDPRKVLLEVLADQARSLRLRRFHVALAQYKDLVGGVSEFEQNTAFLRQLGVEAFHVDPRELRVVDGEIRYGDHPIDMIYRDHEVNDLAAKEEEGADLSAIKLALRTGRCVSTLAGEFDHKSVFQILTSREYEPFFSAEERRVFQHHLPWTRIVADARTEGPTARRSSCSPGRVPRASVWSSTQPRLRRRGHPARPRDRRARVRPRAAARRRAPRPVGRAGPASGGGEGLPGHRRGRRARSRRVLHRARTVRERAASRDPRPRVAAQGRQRRPEGRPRRVLRLL
jgi:hypothetical protein